MNKGVNRMRFVSLHVIVGALLFVIALSTAGPVVAQDLEINNPLLQVIRIESYEWEMSYDFGSVALGTSRTATFDLHSIGSSEVSVYMLYLNSVMSSHGEEVANPDPYLGSGRYCLGSFCFDPDTYPTLPAILPPDQSLIFDVIFTPLSLGEQSAYLGIRSNDTYPPPGSVAFLSLEGTGIEATVPEPSTMILLGTGLIGLVGYGTKKFVKK